MALLQTHSKISTTYYILDTLIYFSFFCIILRIQYFHDKNRNLHLKLLTIQLDLVFFHILIFRRNCISLKACHFPIITISEMFVAPVSGAGLRYCIMVRGGPKRHKMQLCKPAPFQTQGGPGPVISCIPYSLRTATFPAAITAMSLICCLIQEVLSRVQSNCCPRN